MPVPQPISSTLRGASAEMRATVWSSHSRISAAGMSSPV